MRANAANLHHERARIEKELEALMTERQWVITQARKGAFTSADMERQLSILTMQEVSLKHDLSRLGRAIDINALDGWESKFAEYLADLRAGIEELRNAAPQDDEERHHVFLLKKQIIDILVESATIKKNREIKVDIRVNLSKILEQDAASARTPGVYIERVGTYTHIRSIPAHPRRSSSCG